jgi:phosphate transport system permease protein
MDSANTMTTTSEPLALDAREGRPTRAAEGSSFQKLILLNAVLAISVIVLIFVYVGKETLPLFLDQQMEQEVNLNKMFARQSYGAQTWSALRLAAGFGGTQARCDPSVAGKHQGHSHRAALRGALAIAAAITPLNLPLLWLVNSSNRLSNYSRGPLGGSWLLALVVLASWLQNVFQFDYRLNAINAGLAMGLAILPIVYTVSEDALSSVPCSYREASLALGVSPWKTAWPWCRLRRQASLLPWFWGLAEPLARP